MIQDTPSGSGCGHPHPNHPYLFQRALEVLRSPSVHDRCVGSCRQAYHRLPSSSERGPVAYEIRGNCPTLALFLLSRPLPASAHRAILVAKPASVDAWSRREQHGDRKMSPNSDKTRGNRLRRLWIGGAILAVILASADGETATAQPPADEHRLAFFEPYRRPLGQPSRQCLLAGPSGQEGPHRLRVGVGTTPQPGPGLSTATRRETAAPRSSRA